MCAGGQRKRRAAPRQRRQAAGAGEEEEDVEAEFNPENPYQVSHAHKRPGLSARIWGPPEERASSRPGRVSSQLCERQQMPGSRRRGPRLSLQI